MPFDTIPATEDESGFIFVDLPDCETVGFLDESRMLKYADEFDAAFAEPA